MTTDRTLFALPATIGNIGLIFHTRNNNGCPESFSAKLYVTLNNDADICLMVKISEGKLKK